MPARIVAIALLSVGYLALSQWLMLSAADSPWTPAALLGPMLAAVAAGAWAAGERFRSLLAAAAIVALCVQAMVGVLVPAPLLYLAQHVVINVMLGWWFASTLREGHTALITRFASFVHRQMSPAMVVYTRNVTRAWVIYFFAISLVSLVVFALLPFEHWAWFANLGSPIALGAMFAGERLIRYRLHPEFPRSRWSDAIHAYQAAFATPASAPPAPHEPRQ